MIALNWFVTDCRGRRKDRRTLTGLDEMTNIAKPERSPLSLTAQRLRAMALAEDEGHRLGSEDEVLDRLGVSRGTLKQAARLLEQEGLIRVKRGVNGGYYAARPTEDTLKAIANAYLQSIEVAPVDIVAVTTILWLEVVRRAAQAPGATFREALRKLVSDLHALPPAATFHDLDIVEQKSRRIIFDAVDCRYIELIMRINQAFGAQHPFPTVTQDHRPEHRAFAAAWRKAKALELEAIIESDIALADVATRNCRRIWNDRVTMATALQE